MAAQRLSFVLLLGHVVHALAQSASRTSTSAPPSATPTVLSPWVVPLHGMPDQISDQWGGVMVSGFGVYARDQFYVPVLSNTSSKAEPFTGGEDLPALGNTSQPLHPDYGSDLNPPTNDQHQLILGLNSVFNVTFYPDYYPYVKTVPFGLNIGREGVWDGSLVLVGYYDANRTASRTWTRVSNDTQNTFLANGTLVLPSVSIATCSTPAATDCGSSPATMSAVLDYNSDSLQLPSAFACNSSLSITTSPGSEPIIVPANLTADAARCTSGDSALVLGKPFFQAAYIYVDTSHTLWIAQAHQYAVGPNAQVFDASATLAPMASAPAPTRTPTPTSAATLAYSLSPWNIAGAMALLGVAGLV